MLAGVLLVELELGDRRADVGRAAARARREPRARRGLHHLAAAAAVVLAGVLLVEFELAAIEDSRQRRPERGLRSCSRVLLVELGNRRADGARRATSSSR
jgi:hypothetical protein